MDVREVRRLITHDGRFHADEVLATAVLSALFPDAEVVRTRDPVLTGSTCPTDLVYDVGGVHDPVLGRFDHHQPGAPTRPDGSPYSAFGLIWSCFGPDYLAKIVVDPGLVPELQGAVDQSLVRGVDQLDNSTLDPATLGAAAGLTLPALINDLNPAFDHPSPAREGAAFNAAVRLASELLAQRVLSAEAALWAEREVRQAIEASWGDPVLELDRGAPFRRAILEVGAGHVLLVAHPRRADWVVSTVSDPPGSYTTRLDLPEAWAGLEGEELAAVTGVEDAVFCHRARFMAVARTREGALRLAELALDPDPAPEPM